MDRLSIRLLGDFHIAIGDHPLRVALMPRLQELLAFLCLHRSAPQTRQFVAFQFWPDVNEDQARTNLRKLLLHLRQSLPEIEDYLLMQGQHLLWRPGAPVMIDVTEFEQAVAQVQTAADPGATRRVLELAATLYSGDLLPGCYADWIGPERERLRQLATDALRQLIDLLEAQRAYREAVGYGQRLLQFDPANEEVCQTLMRLHALAGNRAAALRVYHACVTALADELGVEPSQATYTSYERLLHADLASATPEVAKKHTTALVGRAAEWRTLQQAWRTAAAGNPHCVLVWGDAGIGKTRLAEELMAWARQQGYAVARAHCYAAQGAPAYAPVATWLRAESVRRSLARLDPIWLSEVTRLLPELLTEQPNLPAPAPLRESWRRQRFFDALARSVASTAAPLLLFLDNAHWCDADTLAWLHFLFRNAASTPLLVVGTVRGDEMDVAHPLNELVTALRQSNQVSVIELGPLDAVETAQLAVQVVDAPLAQAEVEALYRETEGNPLFIVETLRAGWLAHLRNLAAAQPDDGAREAALPATIQAVIAWRLARLSPAAHELASVAAAMGRSFAFEVLVRASQMEEDQVVNGLDELWRRHIVREHGEDAYDFTHDKLREVAYRSLSTARRRLVHRHVAQAMELFMAGQLDAVAGELADHFDQAGMRDQAVDCYRRAAAAAQLVFANDEAIRYCRRALKLAERTTAAGATIATLNEQLGDVEFLVAHYDAARAAYRAAVERLPIAARPQTVRLQRKIANSLREQYRFPEALATLEQARQALLESCGDLSLVDEGFADVAPDPACFDEWLQVNIETLQIHYWTGQVAGGFALLDHLQPTVERRGSLAQQTHLLQQRALLALRRDRYAVSEETLATARAVFAAHQQIGNPAVLPAAHFQFGFFLLWHGDLDEAAEQMQTSLHLADLTGDLSLQARCLTYLTVIARRHGQAEAARDYAGRSFDVATTAGMPEYQGMARANQAWLAWRSQDWQAVEELGKAALACWLQAEGVPGATVFAWAAHWPLLAAAVFQGAYDRAADPVAALLDPRLQQMPDPLITLLERARRAAEQPAGADLYTSLHRALEVAQQMGYL